MEDKQPPPRHPDEIDRGLPPIARGRFGQRASKSADEAWAREVARTWAMTPRERMVRALALAEETEQLLARIGRARR